MFERALDRENHTVHVNFALTKAAAADTAATGAEESVETGSGDDEPGQTFPASEDKAKEGEFPSPRPSSYGGFGYAFAPVCYSLQRVAGVRARPHLPPETALACASRPAAHGFFSRLASTAAGASARILPPFVARFAHRIAPPCRSRAPVSGAGGNSRGGGRVVVLVGAGWGLLLEAQGGRVMAALRRAVHSIWPRRRLWCGVVGLVARVSERERVRVCRGLLCHTSWAWDDERVGHSGGKCTLRAREEGCALRERKK